MPYHTSCFTFYFYFSLFPFAYPNNFCISNTPISPATKAVKAYTYLATNPTSLLKKPKIAPKTLPTITGNASEAFPVLWGHLLAIYPFFKVTSSLQDPEAVGHLPKTPEIASAIVSIVIQSAVSTDIIVIYCSWNKIQILSAKNASLSRTILMFGLILAICVWRSFLLLW